MKKFTYSALALFALGACTSGNPFFGGGGAGGNVAANTIPATLAADLNGATYDAAAGTLTLDIDGLDSPATSAAFTRIAGLDVASADGTTTYEAYWLQTTTANRYYLALFAEGNDTQAGAVATEPEFASSFGGTTYSRLTATDIPTAGSAIFMSGYAGVITEQEPGGADRPTRTSGEVTLSVNITEGWVEGGVSNRVNVDDASALVDIAMKRTALNGVDFFGDVYIGTQDVGDYGGIVAGNVANAAARRQRRAVPGEVAGVLVFDPYSSSGMTEYGVFIAPVCGGPGESTNCP